MRQNRWDFNKFGDFFNCLVWVEQVNNGGICGVVWTLEWVGQEIGELVARVSAWVLITQCEGMTVIHRRDWDGFDSPFCFICLISNSHPSAKTSKEKASIPRSFSSTETTQTVNTRSLHQNAIRIRSDFNKCVNRFIVNDPRQKESIHSIQTIEMWNVDRTMASIIGSFFKQITIYLQLIITFRLGASVNDAIRCEFVKMSLLTESQR